MKKLILAIAVCCSFCIHVTAEYLTDDDIKNYVLRTLIEKDRNGIEEVVLNRSYEADKATFKANEAYFKAKLKDVQSYKVCVTKADLLKTYSIEENKARSEADETFCSKFGLDEASSETDNSANQNKDIKYSKEAVVDANAAKIYAIFHETQTETFKSNSNEAVKLYNKAANFYDKSSKAYEDIVIACSSINPNIIREAEKVKSTKYYAKYEAYVAEKRKAAEFWGKHQSYVKKLKKVSEAYARVAAVRIELHKAAQAYAKAAKTYDKAAQAYAKVARTRNSIKFSEADRLCCFKFEDAVELHKSHKISDAQLASVPELKASYKTIDTYGAYCRTNVKLLEAIVTACCESAEAIKLQTELSKASLEQSQNIVKTQVASISCY